MDVLKASDLKSLTAVNSGPCITIFMPTSISGRDGLQDPVRLKNLVKQAEEKLVNQGVRAPDAKELLKPARELPSNEIYWQRRNKGLAVFVARDQFHSYRVPLELDESVIVDRRFHVKPLLPLLTGDGRYFILAVSQNKPRLLEATRYGVEELEVNALPGSMKQALNYDWTARGPTPHSGAPGPGKQTGVFHGQGGERDTSKDDLAQYFRMIDASLHATLREERAPLLLAGVDFLLPIYREVCTYSHLSDKVLSGNCDHVSPKELHDRTWPLMQPHFDKAREDAAAKYRHLMGTGTTAGDVEHVVSAAYQGRVESLFVDYHAHQWGTYDPATYKVEVHAEAQPGDDDLLDFAAVQTLLHRGAVYAVDREQTPDGAPLAAVLRF